MGFILLRKNLANICEHFVESESILQAAAMVVVLTWDLQECGAVERVLALHLAIFTVLLTSHESWKKNCPAIVSSCIKYE